MSATKHCCAILLWLAGSHEVGGTMEFTSLLLAWLCRGPAQPGLAVAFQATAFGSVDSEYLPGWPGAVCRCPWLLCLCSLPWGMPVLLSPAEQRSP